MPNWRKLPRKRSHAAIPWKAILMPWRQAQSFSTQHCAECHGEMAEGGRKAPSLLADPVQQSTPGTLFWILTNGVVRHGMPVWSKLPEPQRWQIVSYLKSLGPKEKASQ